MSFIDTKLLIISEDCSFRATDVMAISARILLLLLFWIPYIGSNISSIRAFLGSLESSEKFHSFYTLTLDESWYDNDIIKTLKLPKITIQNGLKMNFLNFPRFQVANSLKYYFNYDFVVIIFAYNLNVNSLDTPMFWEIIKYSRSNILIIILDKIQRNTYNPLKLLLNLGFINVIFMDVESFNDSNNLQTFKNYPKFEFSSKFKKESVRNIQHFLVKMGCIFQTPFTNCYNHNGKIIGSGRIFHLFYNFI